MSPFVEAPASLPFPAACCAVGSPRGGLGLRLAHRMVLLPAILIGYTAQHAAAQEPIAPLIADYGDFELPPPVELPGVPYEQFFSATGAEGGQAPADAPLRPPMHAQMTPPMHAQMTVHPAMQLPRRLPATHCDEPGGFAPPPCPPLDCAPPQRQVHVHVPRPAAQPPAFTPQAQQRQPALPSGAFVAPPQAGSVVQEQRSLGLRGLRITFPALTFELPSIELPHWIRRGRSPHMELAAATAPYVAGVGAAQQIMPQQIMPQQINSLTLAAAQRAAGPASAAPCAPPPQAQARPPQQVPPTPAADHASLQQDFEQLQLRCQRLEQLLEKMIQCQPPAAVLNPAQPACPPAPSSAWFPKGGPTAATAAGSTVPK